MVEQAYLDVLQQLPHRRLVVEDVLGQDACLELIGGSDISADYTCGAVL